MAVKLKQDPVGSETLQAYLNEASDFAFELAVLRLLNEKGVICDHGGQYEDPATKKFREFDIRFRHTKGQITVSAAVECKSIGANFPLLVSTVPRKPEEAFHEIFIHSREVEARRSGQFGGVVTSTVPSGPIPGVKVRPSCLYPAGLQVGKSTAQVGKKEVGGEIVANDAEFFEKWTQALQSLDDLIDEIGSKVFIHKVWDGNLHYALALPIVVVPDGTLWSVGYDDFGTCTNEPFSTDRVSILVRRSIGGFAMSPELNVSHLEVMTKTGLSNFVDEFLADAEKLEKFITRG